MHDPIVINEVTLLEERVTGAKAIGLLLGYTERHVRRLAKSSDVPIYRPAGAGHLFAFKSELLRWMRSKPASF